MPLTFGPASRNGYWMMLSFRSIIKRILAPSIRNRWVRFILAPYYYRKVIIPSEKVFQQRLNEFLLDESYWAGRLRKYAHVLDKGLHAEDWQPGRGAEVFYRALAAMEHIDSQSIQDDSSLSWAKERIDRYRERQESKEFELHETVPPKCSYGNLLNTIKTRRSIRRFKSRPVNDSTVQKIASVSAWAPSSCNRQPVKVFATNSPDRAEQCLRTCPGCSCFGPYLPLFMAFCCDFRVYEMAVEVTLPFIDTAMAVQNSLLVAHTLGISLTPLTWAQSSNSDDKRLRELLYIPGHFQIILNAAGGYPAAGVEAPKRKPEAQTLSVVKP